MFPCAPTLARIFKPAALALALALPATAANAPAEGTPQGLALFRAQVRTLLTTRCLECHGGRRTKHGFDVSTRERLLKGGKNGVVVVPYHSDQSHVMALVRKTKKPRMPPKETLSAGEIDALQKWIDQGAPYDGPLK